MTYFLVADGPAADVRVQEIIDIADVGRTTFYAHFETPEQITDYFLATIEPFLIT